MISYNKLCEKYNRILYTTILFTLYSAPPLPSARSAHVRLYPLPPHLPQAPHRACALPRAPRLQNPAWTFSLCSHGQSIFIRPLMDFPNIVVVDFLFEAFCCAYFAAGLSALHFAAHTVLGFTCGASTLGCCCRQEHQASLHGRPHNVQLLHISGVFIVFQRVYARPVRMGKLPRECFVMLSLTFPFVLELMKMQFLLLCHRTLSLASFRPWCRYREQGHSRCSGRYQPHPGSAFRASQRNRC